MSYPCPVGRCDGRATEWGVCRSCAAALARDLALVPALAAEVATTMARQGACVPRSGARGADAPLAYDERASAVLGALKAVLVGWVRVVVEDSPGQSWPEDSAAECARWLGERVALLRVHPAAAEIVTEVGASVRDCWRVIDRVPPLWFGGPCEACGTPMYAEPDASSLTCSACGATYETVGRRRFLLEAARDYRLTIPELGRALLVPPGTLRSWRARGKLAPHGEADGRDTYRIGDVLDLLAP